MLIYHWIKGGIGCEVEKCPIGTSASSVIGNVWIRCRKRRGNPSRRQNGRIPASQSLLTLIFNVLCVARHSEFLDSMSAWQAGVRSAKETSQLAFLNNSQSRNRRQEQKHNREKSNLVQSIHNPVESRIGDRTFEKRATPRNNFILEKRLRNM